MALRLSLALQRHRVGRMPPARGASRHLDQPLRVRGEQVFAQVFDGDVELRQDVGQYKLGKGGSWEFKRQAGNILGVGNLGALASRIAWELGGRVGAQK